MILKNVLSSSIKRLQINKLFKIKTTRKSNGIMTTGVGFFGFLRNKISFLDKQEDKMEKYWKNIPLDEVIEQADISFEKEGHMEVYESLNRIKYCKDIEVIWRLARALYNLSMIPHVANDVKKQMIEEAHEILEKTAMTGTNQTNYHKWMAVIINRKNGLEGLDAKIAGYSQVRDHLKHACNSNPKDFTVQYMLGRWHYEIANLTWLQRKIAKYLFTEPPKSTFQEAYRHLIKAEELNPRSYLPNVYFLGCVCIKLGQYYRAKYYLHMALNLPTHSDCEIYCVSSAKNLLEKLEKYDLGLDLLYENFGFEN